MLGKFVCFFSHLIFSKLTFSKIFFGNSIRVTNKLDPDQDQHLIVPDLGSMSVLIWIQAVYKDNSSFFQGKRYMRLLHICVKYQILVLAKMVCLLKSVISWNVAVLVYKCDYETIILFFFPVICMLTVRKQ